MIQSGLSDTRECLVGCFQELTRARLSAMRSSMRRSWVFISRQAVHFHFLVWRRANSPTRMLTCLTYGEDLEMRCVSAYAPSLHLRSAFESWKPSYKLVLTISRALNFKRRLRSR